MIILPDRTKPRAKFLLPVPTSEWREPSISLPRDQLGNPVEQTRFRIRAKTHDGVTLWRGWFDDRDDFDAFLWAIFLGSLPHERALWELPHPMWPGLDPGLVYDFATVTFYSTAGSNQTWTKPSDWNNSNNKIELLSGGGGGGLATFVAVTQGGGGGAYGYVTNFSASTSHTYRIGAGAAGKSTTNNSYAAVGNDGGPSWWNGTSFNNGTLTLNAGTGGGANSGSNTAITASNNGTVGTGTGNAGGSGGTTNGSSTTATGGGGAGGPNGAGVNSANLTQGNRSSAGGNGDNGSGGAGGANGPVSGQSANVGSAGGNGTEWQASPAYGSGGGGGGAVCNSDNTNTTAGNGGNYGAGGGAASSETFSSGSTTSGAGIQGLLVITYTPPTTPEYIFNMPMLGM